MTLDLDPLESISQLGRSRPSTVDIADRLDEDLTEPVAIRFADLKRVEVLNRARFLRVPTARLHLKDGSHLDIGIVASLTTPSFRSVNHQANNRAFDDWLSQLSGRLKS